MRTTVRLALPLALVLAGCAAAPAKRDPRDPWERLNRTTFAFNNHFDHAVALPVARAYQKVTPQFVRVGVGNFFDNLDYPIVIVNDLLQAQLKDFFSDTARLVLNTTLGLGGFFDPASSAGLDKNTRDFGQTLGKWGIGTGPYLVLPLFGPSDVRDAFGRVGDGYAVPQTYVLSFWPAVGVWVAGAINTRYQLLPQQSLIESTFDPYAFERSAYLQRRQYLVTGGSSHKEEEEEEQMLDELNQEESTPPAPKKPKTPPKKH